MLGSGFPNNLIEFENDFSSEEQCLKHLFTTRYPEGFFCIKCNTTKFWWTKRQLLHCQNCGHQTSLKKGTVLEGSKKSIKLWYRAIYLEPVPNLSNLN